MAHRHFDVIKQGDVVVYDRYYPSFLLMFRHIANGSHFCVKMKNERWNQVKDFLASGKKQQVITIHYPKRDSRAKEYKLPDLIQVRLVKKVNKKGDVSVYCTSLMDDKIYSAKSIINLYKFRWSLEEAYKFIKSRLSIENFSGKTATAVLQDFFAKTFLLTLTNIIAFETVKPQKIKVGRLKIKIRTTIVNRTYVANQIKKKIIKTLLTTLAEVIETFLNKVIEKVKSKKEYSRRGQKSKRKFKPNIKFGSSYKAV